MSTSSRSVYTIEPSDLEYQPGTDRTHRGPKPGKAPGARWSYGNSCWGQLRALYGREAVGELPEPDRNSWGSYGRQPRGSRKVAWVKTATICVRCGAFWPEPGLLEQRTINEISTEP